MSTTMDPLETGPHRIGLGRLFTSHGVDPYDEVVWERRDARITNWADGTVAFEQTDVEFPAGWSLNATNIVAQKYFRGTIGTPERESSLRQVVDRVVDTITRWGIEGGYFADDAEASAFSDELKYILVTQRAAFNSPVWFNIGVDGVPQQASACYILEVDDTMDSILEWYRQEGLIFKGGSGAGTNLSRIRSSAELLKGGGTASGPVSFMRGADASAGTIKSGGKTRRAAKMVILNADHPDIEEFVWCKAIEERKTRVLRDAGFDMDLDGKDSFSVQYQNANNSVRVTDEFMQAVIADADWELRAVTTGEPLRTVKARDLWRDIAQAAWECADPGLQFDTTINRWHTLANTGPIEASNPCSEFLSVNNSACNLASINLLPYLDDDRFDVDAFKHTVELVFTAQEILVGRADYPTEKLTQNSYDFRQLGLGYTNIGAMLMALGLPYDSVPGRAWAAAITSLMTGHAYATSARTAARVGPFAGFAENEEHMLRVLRMHRDAAHHIGGIDAVPPYVVRATHEAWESAVRAGEEHGVRNSQATVLAPTGCLVGGTLVATDRGLVRLASLGNPHGSPWQDLETRVLTDDGPKDATRFYVNGLEPVVNVETARGYQIRGTTTHRIKVLDDQNAWVWRRLAEVKPGDRVPLARGQVLGDPREVWLPPLSESSNWTREHHVHVPHVVDPHLAEMVGYFMGDGSLHSSALRFCVNNGDADVIERLAWLAKDLFGIEAVQRQQTGFVSVELNSVRLVSWWEACGFAKRVPSPGHRGKGYIPHIPDAILHTNDPDAYAAFLRGLFEADGTVGQGYPCWSTAHDSFAVDVQTLLLALGFPTTRRQLESRMGSRIEDVRLLDMASHERWLEVVGFMSARKHRAVALGGHRQASKFDGIPVTRALIDRVQPANGANRRVALMEFGRHRAISRRLASVFYDQTDDAELGRLLGFFFDSVASAELGDEEFTYDLSVPANVTYVANGFVSHNTISFMMDADTTGIEPDLSLIKTKKLVGGGTMSIVNQTVPRALAHLGYDESQIAEIVAYIDHEKSVIGAPHLSPDHLPVFACSMGDNPIHYEGHVRMLAAVQPFISGAVSKTTNMPETATVDEVAHMHQLAWELGLKSIAIYRDNCKVGQPLSTTKKASAGEPTTGQVTLFDGEAASGATQIVERIVETVVHRPVRQKLPRNRRGRTFEFRVADCKGFLTVGEYDDGRPGEVFLTVSKQGSTLAGIMDAFAKSISYGLQYGVPLRAFVEAFTNMRFEPAGMTDDPEIRFASSVMDYLFRKLAMEYLSYDERAELSIFSVSERMQPTLPGMEESLVETTSGTEMAVDPKSVPGAEELADQMHAGAIAQTPDDNTPAAGVLRDADAPMCMQCGVTMVRAGSCHACPSCGSTSGCS